jgi:hypothetical protein
MLSILYLLRRLLLRPSYLPEDQVAMTPLTLLLSPSRFHGTVNLFLTSSRLWDFTVRTDGTEHVGVWLHKPICEELTES